MQPDIIKKYPVACLLAISMLMLLPHLGLIQTNIMEARNLITAREMAHNHEWIFTTLNNLPRYEKPPLPTWLTAAFGSVFGFRDMFFLRLPVALVTLMLVFFFYRLVKKILPEGQQAFYSSLVLITSFYIFFSGRDNQWDMYTHAFMIPCIFFLVLLFCSPTIQFKYALLAGLFFGLSFLSKGPVSPYALFLPFLPAYFIVYPQYLKRNLLLLLPVLLIGLAIGLSWPLYVKYFDAAHVNAAVSQEATRWSGYEAKPFWYYWSFFTQSGIWTLPALVALIYPYMKSRVSDLKAYRFAILWTIFSVVLLSLIPEKKARYLLPVLIPLAMNTGFYIEYLFRRFKEIKNKGELSVIYFSFGLIGIIALALPAALIVLLKTKLNGYLFWVICGSVASLLCGIFILRGLIKRYFANCFYGVIFFMCSLSVFFIPVSKAYYQNDKYFSAGDLKKMETQYGLKTYELNGFTPEIIWDYGSSIPEINVQNKFIVPNGSFFVLVRAEEEALLKQQLPNYSFKKMGTVDLNDVPQNSKTYNNRLVRSYLLAEKIK